MMIKDSPEETPDHPPIEDEEDEEEKLLEEEERLQNQEIIKSLVMMKWIKGNSNMIENHC